MSICIFQAFERLFIYSIIKLSLQLCQVLIYNSHFTDKETEANWMISCPEYEKFVADPMSLRLQSCWFW